MGVAAASYGHDAAAVAVAEGDNYPHADHAVDSDHRPLDLEEAYGQVVDDETDVADIAAVAVVAAVPLDGAVVVVAAAGQIDFERIVDEAVVAADQLDGTHSRVGHIRQNHLNHAHRDVHVASDRAFGSAQNYCTCSVSVL